jgi:hypothetical protein
MSSNAGVESATNPSIDYPFTPEIDVEDDSRLYLMTLKRMLCTYIKDDSKDEEGVQNNTQVNTQEDIQVDDEDAKDEGDSKEEDEGYSKDEDEGEDEDEDEGENEDEEAMSKVLEFFEYIESDSISRDDVAGMLLNLDDILPSETISDLRQCLQIGIYFDEDCVKGLHYLSNKYGHFSDTKKWFDKFIKFVETENAIFPFEALSKTLDMTVDPEIGMDMRDGLLLGDCHQHMLSLI